LQTLHNAAEQGNPRGWLQYQMKARGQRIAANNSRVARPQRDTCGQVGVLLRRASHAHRALSERLP
jgi:hypothetical protein